MHIPGPDRSIIPPDYGSGERAPQNREEAARQFEEVLIRQMMQTMTRNLFDGSLTGEGGSSWSGAYGDLQSDVLATHLAKELSSSGKLGIAELLIKQWQRAEQAQQLQEDAGTPPHETESPTDSSTPVSGSIHPFTEA